MESVPWRAAATLVLVALAGRAEAFPAFARKYAMSCTACHVAWPILNQVGESFRDNGYQFGLGKDDPNTLPPGYVPLAVRTTPQYLYSRVTNQAVGSDPAPRTVDSGGVQAPQGVDLLTGGSVSPGISYLVVIAGFTADEPGGIESAFVRFNRLGGSPWLNLKVGKFELEQPASTHRGVSLASEGYFVYGAHPEGSLVGFEYGDNQVGLELSGHDDRSALRYAISVTSADGGGQLQKGAWSAPMAYGRLVRSFETGSGVLPWVRLGVLGGVGSWPSAGVDDGQGGIVPGTGTSPKSFSRYGADLAFVLGNPATPAFVTVAWMGGSEAAGLAGPGSSSNTFQGGFAELDWVPFSEPSEVATPWLLFGRYDLLRYGHGAGDSQGYTVGVRRYLAFGPRASAALHLELHGNTVKGVGAADPVTALPRNVDTTAVLAGVDFDF